MTRRGKGKSTFSQNEAEDLDDDIEDIPEDELTDAPLTNATEVLLFSGTGMQGKNAIAKLRLIKLDNPGAGYKGEIPLNSTLETIGQTFGDGNYQIEALNASHKVLRTLSNQKIALQNSLAEKPASNVAYLPGSNAAELDRVQNLAMQTARESKEQSQQFLTLVTTMLSSTAERERSHAAETRRETQAFMTGMLAAQQATFAQMMTLLQTGHNQTLEQLRALPRNTDNSEKMIAMLMQGISMGREIDEPEETPFWKELLEGGTKLLSGVAAARSGEQAPSTALATTTATPDKPGKSIKLTPKRKKELKAMIELQQALRSQGIDPVAFTDMLKNGEFSMERPPESEPDDESDDIDDEETEDDIDAEESSSEPGESGELGDDDSESDTE
jgi:hypothetical protein